MKIGFFEHKFYVLYLKSLEIRFERWRARALVHFLLETNEMWKQGFYTKFNHLFNEDQQEKMKESLEAQQRKPADILREDLLDEETSSDSSKKFNDIHLSEETKDDLAPKNVI